MICAGKGAGVIANIWNGSLDKRNICTMLGEKQAEEQESSSEGKRGERGKGKKKRQQTRWSESLHTYCT